MTTTDPDLAAIERDHPAKFSAEVLAAIQATLDRYLEPGAEVLDPFAGTGRIHELTGYATTGVELEPEWADARAGTIVGDATNLPDTWTHRFAAVATSPCYGNRMADSHNAQDACKTCAGEGTVTRTMDGATLAKPCPVCRGAKLSRRMTYTHRLRALTGDPDRTLAPTNAGAMQWGRRYRLLHADAIREMVRCTRPGDDPDGSGLLVVNMSNHLRTVDGNEVEQRVIEWWANALTAAGCYLLEVVPIATRRMGLGENRDARTDTEVLLVVRTPPAAEQGRLL